jgi:hypothetical protein
MSSITMQALRLPAASVSSRSVPTGLSMRVATSARVSALVCGMPQ